MWGGGGSLGSVFADFNVNDFDDGSVTTGHVDRDDSGWKLFGGYRINRHVSFEGGYVDLNNDYDGETTFTGISDGNGTFYQSFPSAPISVDIDNPGGLYIAAVGSIPLSEKVEMTDISISYRF